MEDIWQQFHRLPKVIRDAVASPAALAAMNRIEAAHPGLDLAGFIMRVMVRELPVADLPKELIASANLDESAAKEVADDVTETIFQAVHEYLGLPERNSPSITKPAPSATVPLSQPNPNPPAPAKPSPTVMVPSTPATVVPAPSPAPLAQPSAPTGVVSPAPTLSIEDDAEIAAHAEKLRTMTTPVGPQDFDATAGQILEQHRLAFQDDLLTKRAIAVIKARLKGIRSSEDTSAMLMRPPKVGGLGLDPDIAAAVTRTIDEKATQVISKGMVAPRVVEPPPPPPRVPAPERQAPAAVPPLTRDFSTMKPDAGNASVTEAPRPSRPIYRPADIPPPPPVTTKPASSVSVKKDPTPPVATKPSPAVQRPRMSDRPTVSDITVPKTTLGPAEEMQSFTLAQFRRLGQGAAESAKKILDKLKNLQSESFSLWAEAVAGWRKSEVYTIYLDMGRQSLDQSLPIDQVIQRRATAGQPYLSEHEFNVLADMNRHLQL